MFTQIDSPRTKNGSPISTLVHFDTTPLQSSPPSSLLSICNIPNGSRRCFTAVLFRFLEVTKAMSSAVDAVGEPIPTSAVLMAASKHIAARCRAENVAFINCKKKDPNPEKCLEKGRQVTSCVLNLLKELHQKCPKEMDAYAGCMYYYTNEFDLCRKEQQEFEKACPISE